MIEKFDFGEALRRMKAGKKVCSEHLHTMGINWYKLSSDAYYFEVSDCNTEYIYSIAEISVEEMLLEDWYEVENNE